MAISPSVSGPKCSYFGSLEASYTAGDQRVVSPTPAELAVDAIRRPWIEEGGDTERAGCRAPPEKAL